MDELKIKSNGLVYTCDECKNDNSIEESLSENDFVECEYCGIEYRIIGKDDNGNFDLELMEEEK